MACIDDPHRFENGRQVSAYFGLVPRQYQSGETDRNGRITKRGNPLARTILVECAWASMRYNPGPKESTSGSVASRRLARRRRLWLSSQVSRDRLGDAARWQGLTLSK